MYGKRSFDFVTLDSEKLDSTSVEPSQRKTKRPCNGAKWQWVWEMDKEREDGPDPMWNNISAGLGLEVRSLLGEKFSGSFGRPCGIKYATMRVDAVNKCLFHIRGINEELEYEIQQEWQLIMSERERLSQEDKPEYKLSKKQLNEIELHNQKRKTRDTYRLWRNCAHSNNINTPIPILNFIRGPNMERKTKKSSRKEAIKKNKSKEDQLIQKLCSAAFELCNHYDEHHTNPGPFIPPSMETSNHKKFTDVLKGVCQAFSHPKETTALQWRALIFELLYQNLRNFHLSSNVVPHHPPSSINASNLLLDQKQDETLNDIDAASNERARISTLQYLLSQATDTDFNSNSAIVFGVNDSFNMQNIEKTNQASMTDNVSSTLHSLLCGNPSNFSARVDAKLDIMDEENGNNSSSMEKCSSKVAFERKVQYDDCEGQKIDLNMETRLNVDHHYYKSCNRYKEENIEESTAHLITGKNEGNFCTQKLQEQSLVLNDFDHTNKSHYYLVQKNTDEASDSCNRQKDVHASSTQLSFLSKCSMATNESNDDYHCSEHVNAMYSKRNDFVSNEYIHTDEEEEMGSFVQSDSEESVRSTGSYADRIGVDQIEAVTEGDRFRVEYNGEQNYIEHETYMAYSLENIQVAISIINQNVEIAPAVTSLTLAEKCPSLYWNLIRLFGCKVEEYLETLIDPALRKETRRRKNNKRFVSRSGEVTITRISDLQSLRELNIEKQLMLRKEQEELRRKRMEYSTCFKATELSYEEKKNMKKILQRERMREQVIHVFNDCNLEVSKHCMLQQQHSSISYNQDEGEETSNRRIAQLKLPLRLEAAMNNCDSTIIRQIWLEKFELDKQTLPLIFLPMYCRTEIYLDLLLKGFTAKYYMKNCEVKGRGVYSECVMYRGDFFCEYKGELLSVQEAKVREERYARAEEYIEKRLNKIKSNIPVSPLNKALVCYNDETTLETKSSFIGTEEKGNEYKDSFDPQLLAINQSMLNEVECAEDEIDYLKKPGCFIFYFDCNRKTYSIDSTSEIKAYKESWGPGRLVNHSRLKPNLEVRALEDRKGVPRLFFVAKKDLYPHDELLVDYGDRDPMVLKQNPWLFNS